MNRRKLKTLTLTCLLLAASLTQFACGEYSTLARYAPAIAPLADILGTAFGQMKTDGVITPARYDELMRADPATGLNIVGKIKEIGVYLTSISTVTANNKPQIVTKINDGLILTARVISGITPGSKGARVLSSIRIGLDAVLVAVTIIQPPPASFSLGVDAGIPSGKVQVKRVKLDADIERELAAKMRK